MSLPDGARGRVLLLEDDPGISRLVSRQLERAGFHTESAATTAAARTKLAAEPFDLLLLDYNLGEGKTGVEFYSELQKEGREIAAILMTAFSDEQRLVEALRAGVRDYILKTPNFMELVVPTVEGVIQQVRDQRELHEARTASRAKDDFLATLSHELRTPLTPVLALVSAMQRDERLPQDVREDMTTIMRNIELEARLIDDLLDVTRIVRGKLELRLDYVDLRGIIQHAVKTCCVHEAAERFIVCHEDLSERPHIVHGDPARLTQVFWNLLKNAIKFTPVGGQTWVRTRFEKRDEKRLWLVVEITDTGIGIEPEVLPTIFGAFEQGGRGVTRQFGGLGLGLAIGKAIIDLHGGTITAASAGKGQGATFTVRLPLVEDAAPVPAAAPKTERVSSDGAADSLAHLLLVEDHSDTANVMARMLRRRGYHVTVASSVAQAKAAALAAHNALDDGGRSRAFGLVISDLGLPDGTGHDLMRELRETYRLSGIALSGFGMDEDVQRALDAGFVKHLTKPVEFDSLVTNIREALARTV